jgi:selenocysteine-specific elongation factor
MPHLVIGTAGHIDHGKTSLVKALTGIDADRLQEEKQRGITIDIGFAHTDLSPNLTLSFVDLPGHERFIKNMLAGVSGIDALLFVVASDESIKPQTREHFEICRLLGIRQGVIALTKSDLADPDTLELVRLEVEDLVANSFLAKAPILHVSAHTGAGLDQLRESLTAIASNSKPRNAAGYFRLPVDRAFSIKGFGTVATGTLISGSLRPESEVELYPTGQRLRVRGLQVHGKPVNQATAGQRTAINLAGIEPSAIHRGMVLSEPGRFRPATRLDCRYELVPGTKPLKARARVHFHSGASEIQAEVRKLLPDSQARIVLRHPILILPGDRFVLRAGSPLNTIAGGSVLTIDAPRKRPHIQTIADAIASTGKLEADVRQPGPDTQFIEPDLLVDRAWLNSQQQALEEAVKAFHGTEPLKPGLPRQSLNIPKPILDHLLATTKTLVSDSDLIRHRDHKIVLQQDDSEARAAIENAFAQANLTVPTVDEVLAASGVPVARAKSILQILLREKILIRVGTDLVFHANAIKTLRATLAQHKGQTFNVGTFKDWTNISRKYAIPLLEYLDRERVTRRIGNDRVLLG